MAVPSARARRVPLLVLLAFTFFSTASSQTCYFQDGSVATGNVPCNPNSGSASSCCGPGWACLGTDSSFAICAAVDGSGYARGACTDQSFSDPRCPRFCFKNNGVSPCPGDPNRFYCFTEGQGNCTSGNDAIFFACKSPASQTPGPEQGGLAMDGRLSADETSPIYSHTYHHDND
jgi:hypothetical protein